MTLKIIYPENVIKIASLLRENGFEAYAVGGCIRDALMGREPADWDLTTNATPYEMIEIFSRSDIKTIPTGLKHGTVTLLIGNNTYECTTYRIDGEYNDSRHPENVTFTRNIGNDLGRRDFTINALAGNPLSSENQIVDLFSGMSDIEDKIVRCVGDPQKRFSEDALRILRAVRFSTVLGFELDCDTERAAEELGERLEYVSAERKSIELEKILLSDNADCGIELLLKLKLAKYIHPDIHKPQIPLSSLEASFAVRLASLFIGDSSPKLSCMKLSNAVSSRVALLCDNRLYELCKSQFRGNDAALCRLLLSKFGDDACSAVLLRQDGHLCEQIRLEAKKNPCVSINDLAINGKDLLNIGIEPIKISKINSALLLAVIEAPSLNTPEKLTYMAKSISKSISQKG